ncbi:protealysin inhibitor emfourin [Siccibacter turicensis]|uniref:protealysin inhibitor emfourin n=1 Tax=Siccibacter turicensis TaxID=357233 RepID=UPI001020A86D|nr:protealysin inhibitor emfourin [Siccibacter turicensis]
MNLPELTDDAVIELAREGGVAFIPRLSAPRRIVLAELTPEQRERLAEILRQALPQAHPPGQPDSPGRGDQRYYRIQIAWTHHDSSGYADIVLLVPENSAPPALQNLWKRGEDCICD